MLNMFTSASQKVNYGLFAHETKPLKPCCGPTLAWEPPQSPAGRQILHNWKCLFKMALYLCYVTWLKDNWLKRCWHVFRGTATARKTIATIGWPEWNRVDVWSRVWFCAWDLSVWSLNVALLSLWVRPHTLYVFFYRCCFVKGNKWWNKVNK